MIFFSNRFGIISGSPCKTARFLENSLKFPGRFKLKRGTNDISWIQPKRSQVASIVPPKINEIKVLDARVSSKDKRLALDCAWAAAFSESERTERKNGISFETFSSVKELPSESVNSSGVLKVTMMFSKLK